MRKKFQAVLLAAILIVSAGFAVGADSYTEELSGAEQSQASYGDQEQIFDNAAEDSYSDQADNDDLSYGLNENADPAEEIIPEERQDEMQGASGGEETDTDGGGEAPAESLEAPSLTEEDSEEGSGSDLTSGTETDSQAGAEEAPAVKTDENSVLGLTAESDQTELVMDLPEDSPLSADAQLVFYAGTYIRDLYGFAQEEWDYDTFAESMKAGWEKTADPEEIEYFYPFYIEVRDGSGETIELPEGTKLYLNFKDREVYTKAAQGGSQILLGTEGEEGFETKPRTEIILNAEKSCISAALNISGNPGLGSMILLPDEKSEGENPDAENDLGDGSGDGIMLAAEEVDSKGSPIAGVSGWTKTGDLDQLDSSYLSLRWYQGKSSYERIGSNVNGQWKLLNVGGINDVWLPLKGGINGFTQGARYNKVLYDYKTAAWYDVKYTIKSISSGGSGTVDGKTVSYYPYIGFNRERLGLKFYRFGDVWIKVQILKNGTDTEVKKNIRMAVWDIDSCQYVSVDPGNSQGRTFARRYYYANSVLRAKNNFNSDGSLANSYVESPNTASSDTDKENLAIWDLQNVSCCYVGIGYYNNASAGNDWLALAYNYLKNNDGSVIYENYNTEGLSNTSTICAFVNIAGQTPNPPTLSDPVKQVSNAKTSGYSSSNTLGSVNDAYWYQIDCYVPEISQNSHAYSSMVLKDSLPKGVSYAGEWTAECVEKGNGAAGLFDFADSAGNLSFSAKASALSQSSFYGYTYRIRFKAKLDPATAPSSIKNNTRTYTVKNTSSLVIKRLGKTETLNSGTVTTTASTIRTGSVTVTKKILKKDIVWAHGNPVFRFVLTGKDANGKSHTYEDYVEFQKDGGTADASGYVSLSKTFASVPLGTYTIYERETLRYQLKELKADTANGSVKNNKGEAVLSAASPNASFTFTNGKTDYSGYSHTNVIRNTVPVRWN